MSDPSSTSVRPGAQPGFPTGEAAGGTRIFTPGHGAQELTWREIRRRPLPFLADDAFTRRVIRLVAGLARRRVLEVHGAHHVAPERDPFIFALNHNQRPEAVLVPSLLIVLRRGKQVHFLADWPFLLVPGIATLYRCNRVIPVMTKSPKPRFLRFLKPLVAPRRPAPEEARERLAAGGAVGIFPEATVNRDDRHLLRGQKGAARLALATGVPVVTAGIRFPFHTAGQPITDR